MSEKLIEVRAFLSANTLMQLSKMNMVVAILEEHDIVLGLKADHGALFIDFLYGCSGETVGAEMQERLDGMF